MQLEYVSALVTGVTELKNRLEDSKRKIAIAFLDRTYSDIPRPPWNTGALRSSGKAYVNQKLVAQTPDTPPNPKGYWIQPRTRLNRKTGKFVKIGGLSRGSIPDDFQPQDAFVLPKSMSGRDTISVLYLHPVAALMHEWTGDFSDVYSGRHYITAKFTSLGIDYMTIMGTVFK